MPHDEEEVALAVPTNHSRAALKLRGEDEDSPYAHGAKVVLASDRTTGSDDRTGGSSELCRWIAGELSLDDEEAEALHFGFFGGTVPRKPTTGTARNRAFAATSKPFLISLDDDILCRGVIGTTGNPIISTRLPGYSLTYSDDARASVGEAHLQPIAIDAVYCTFLESACEALRAMGQEALSSVLDPEEVTPELFRKLESGPLSVDVVSFGTIGDSGMSNRHGVPLNGPRAPKVWSDDLREQELALTSRQLVRRPTQPILTTSPFFMTTACAYCLNNLLPPFFPFGRGQDNLFGTMYTGLFADGAILHCPTVLMHEPFEPRGNRIHPPDRISVRVTTVLATLVNYYRRFTSGGSREERLRDFGQWLVELAGLEHQRFRERISGFLLAEFEAYRAQLAERIAEAARNDGSLRSRVIRDLDDHLAARLHDRDILPIEEYAGDGIKPEEQFVALAQDILRYGRLLTIWPEVWDLLRSSDHPQGYFGFANDSANP